MNKYTNVVKCKCFNCNSISMEKIEIQKKYDEQNELLNYKSKLKSEAESFHDYLGSCSRYLQNKRLEDVKYQG